MDSAKIARFVVHPEIQAFRPGEYSALVFGDPNPADGRPAIATPGGSRLDGEPQPGGAYPSGNGVQGGIFKFKFQVN